MLFSLLAQYFFIAWRPYPPKKLDQWLMWTIMAAIIGNIIGTGLVACLVPLARVLGKPARLSRRAEASAVAPCTATEAAACARLQPG